MMGRLRRRFVGMEGFCQECGYATILVLAIVVLVGAILAGYGLWVRWEAHATASYQDRLTVRQISREGIGLGLSRLRMDPDPDVDWLGERWATTATEQASPLDGAQRLGTPTISAGSNATPAGAAGAASIAEAAPGTATVTIEDEGSKLGLNWMDEPLWKAIPGMRPEWADALLDWRDPDRDPRPLGAEGGGVRNGLFSSLQDLRRVTGFKGDPTDWLEWATTYSLFNVNAVGEDVLQAVWIGAGIEPGRARTIAKEIVAYRSQKGLVGIESLLDASLSLSRNELEGVRRWLTVEGPVNVNTAPVEALRALLTAAGYDSGAADRIVQTRKQRSFRAIGDLMPLLGSATGGDRQVIPIRKWVTLKSSIFRIVSAVDSPKVVTEAVVRRSWDAQTRSWDLEVLAWSEGG